jgi:murein DD-endopeptidase MepM/ murein hydrolase activator NlpD
MPAVITRNGSRVLLGAALVLTLLVLLGTALIAVLIQDTRQGLCGSGGLVGGPPGPSAETIPARLMPLYVAAERAYGVPWNVVAAINKVETDFGRNLNVSSAGAIGWMQFMPNTWARYGVDGNDDGEKDPYDPEDAIPSAANYLRASAAAHDLHAAILAYNHAEWYYEQVISWARRFVLGPMLTGPEAAATNTADDRTSGTASYPLARRGPIIATPADHRARPLGNWQSDNAIDIAVPTGTEVLAVGDGTVEQTGGSAPRRGGGVLGGYNVTLRTADNGYFYAHLRRVLVRPGEHVKDGQVLGESGYANGVDHLHLAVQYGDPMTVSGGTASTSAIAPACTAGDGGLPGTVEIAPGANLPGRPITPETLAYLATVASIYGKPLIVTTGTNHSQYTVDGNVSDHFDGHAADIGMGANGESDDSPIGDAIAAACLIAAGDPPGQATREARQGGLWTRAHDGLRIQCIWKTDEGGNHHTHVHIGARPAAT